MKKKMKSLGILLLILVLLEVICCEGCWKEEREALLALNSRMGNTWTHAYPFDDNTMIWNDNDCCKWHGVECNTTTGRVVTLHLSDFRDYWLGLRHLNFSDFKVFSDLKSLDLANNQISSCVESEGLENLEVLDLSNNDFRNVTSILSCLDGLSSLKSLSLTNNMLDEIPFRDLHTMFETLSSKLLHLEALDISYNYHLTNDILPSLKGFTSLIELYMSNIELNSDHHIQGLCAVLKNLEVIDVSNNNFGDNTDIASALSGLLSLKSLYLKDSKITKGSIHNISKLMSLEILDLSVNNLNESLLWPLENDRFAWPTSLQVLGLSMNSFSNNNLSHLISGLPHLKSLDLSVNQLNVPVYTSDWSKFTKLQELDLSENAIVGPLPSSFMNLTSLRTLKLDENNFTGNIGSVLASVTSLEYLSFEGNQFDFPISFAPFVNHSNLKFIYGNGNKVILDPGSTSESWSPKFQLQVLQLKSTTDFKVIPLPTFLSYQYNLTSLDFTGCKLGGEFPNWLLKNNTNMRDLVLKNCRFTGEFQLPSHPLVNMEKFDISNNAVKGQLPMNNISSIFPGMRNLFMSGNLLHGSIPYDLSNISSLTELNLSDNQFSGEIPHDISRAGQQLKLLKLSNNKLDGSIPPSWSNNELQLLFLDGNFLSGCIPSGFYNSSMIQVVDLSNNHFMGEIPSHIKNYSLEELYMSGNHFQGSIPPELAQLKLLNKLDLSQNKLTGCVPSFKNSSIQFIQLGNNNLSCLPKRMFKENSSLLILDLSYNEITKGMQNLVHELSYSQVTILLMKANHFSGNIPKQLCQLNHLHILDLSHNKLVGEIPNCLAEIHFDYEEDFDSNLPESFNTYRGGKYEYLREKANFTSKKRSETYSGNVIFYMSGIDLSCNKLSGNIPPQLGNLTRVRSLNLSHNYLTGKIPATFSNLVQVESLDLSFNKLSGQIPPQLCGLTSLEVFSVAYNNLSGTTPERVRQFSTFDESSYKGNQFLCGPPLSESCNTNVQTPLAIPNNSNKDEDNDSWVDMYVFSVSFVVSYTSILLIIATVLYINPYWRQAWFYYVELVVMNCYYFIEDNLCKFF